MAKGQVRSNKEKKKPKAEWNKKKKGGPTLRRFQPDNPQSSLARALPKRARSCSDATPAPEAGLMRAPQPRRCNGAPGRRGPGDCLVGFGPRRLCSVARRIG